MKTNPNTVITPTLTLITALLLAPLAAPALAESVPANIVLHDEQGREMVPGGYVAIGKGTIHYTPDNYRRMVRMGANFQVIRNPVKEIATLYARTDTFDNLTAEAANAKLATLKPELIDMSLTFAPAGNFTLNVRGLKIDYDAATKEFVVMNEARVKAEKAAMLKRPVDKQQPYRDIPRRAVSAPEVDGKVTLRVLVDRASLELFVNDGQAAATFVMVPAADNRSISIEGNPAMKLTSLVVNELESSWQ